MDIQMPVMDGFEALRAMQSRGLHVPVVALTAHAMKGDKEKCIEAGFTTYISKPASTETLVKTIAALIEFDFVLSSRRWTRRSRLRGRRCHRRGMVQAVLHHH